MCLVRYALHHKSIEGELLPKAGVANLSTDKAQKNQDF